MEEKEMLCNVPRNLSKPDTVIHYPIKLNWKQITYIGIGVVGAYVAFQTVLPLVYKLVITSGTMGMAAIASLVRIEDSTIDELAIDSLYFAQKKNVYRQLEKREVVIEHGYWKEVPSADGKPNFTIPATTLS